MVDALSRTAGPTVDGLPALSVSAFFPCYNDGATIGQLVLDVDAALAASPLVAEHEVIVVDDGSADDSAVVLAETAALCPRLRVITHDANRGYGGALITGFAAATKEWIFYTDGDAQYDPREVVELLAVVGDDVDIVQGWKIGRGDSWYRKVIGRAYHHGVKLLFGLQVRDTDCDFRLFRRQLIVDTPLTSTSGVICVEMMRRFQQAGAGSSRSRCTTTSGRPASRSSSACRRSPAPPANSSTSGAAWCSAAAELGRHRAPSRSRPDERGIMTADSVPSAHRTWSPTTACRERPGQERASQDRWTRVRSWVRIRAVAPQMVSSSSSKKWIGQAVSPIPQRSSRWVSARASSTSGTNRIRSTSLVPGAARAEPPAGRGSG